MAKSSKATIDSLSAALSRLFKDFLSTRITRDGQSCIIPSEPL